MTELLPGNGQQIVTEVFLKSRRVAEASERCPIESARECAQSTNSHLDWTMLAIWSFVVFSFAAFFFCGLIIWAKFRGG
jgi:hypothetical protein